MKLTLLVLILFVSNYERPYGASAAPVDEDYDGFVRALEAFKTAYNFSTEEARIQDNVVESIQIGEFDETLWVMGVRGKDVKGHWVKNRCNAIMIHQKVAMMPCACMWSWYLTYARFYGRFNPAKDRTEFDITAPDLYLHHTVHLGEDYFRDEEQKYYGVSNWPLESPECRAAIDIMRYGNRDILKYARHIHGVGIVETIEPVLNGTAPVVVPLYYKDDCEGGCDHTVLLSYNTNFVRDNYVYIPNYQKTEYTKKKERWRTWSNNNEHIRNELVAPDAAICEGDCRACNTGLDLFGAGTVKEMIDKLECWRLSQRPQLQCDVWNGAPLTDQFRKLHGIALTSWTCETARKEPTDHPDNAPVFRVRRFKDTHDTLIKHLRLYEVELEVRRNREEKENEKQRLFNLERSQAIINYDEDLDPRIRLKINTVVQKNPEPEQVKQDAAQNRRRSEAPNMSNSHALEAVILFLWLYY